ncbi:MAG: hypothetical protein AAF620_18145, partial [Bacteroidota bacterium]
SGQAGSGYFPSGSTYTRPNLPFLQSVGPRILNAGFGDYLLPTEKHYNGSLGLVGVAIGGYNKIPNDIKRKYAYKLSKTIGAKSGKIFQGTKAFVNNTTQRVDQNQAL